MVSHSSDFSHHKDIRCGMQYGTYCCQCRCDVLILSQFCSSTFLSGFLSVNNVTWDFLLGRNVAKSWGQGEGHVSLTAVTVILASLLEGLFLSPIIWYFLLSTWFDFKYHGKGLQHSSPLSVAGFLLVLQGVLGLSSCCHTLFLLRDLSCVNQTTFNPFFGYHRCHTSIFFPLRCFRLMLGHGTRWGEAQNPGPTYRFAVTNPTSVISKANHYSFLRHQFDIHTFIAAETSATGVAQKIFSNKLKQLSMKACWSSPAPDQFETVSGEPSLRGKAMGVACFSSLPIRPAIATLPSDFPILSRLSHQLLTLGKMQIQLVVVYGYPSTYRDSAHLNSHLIQVALDAIDCLPLPSIIAGDFNCDPFELEIAGVLRDRGFSDLKAIHRQLKRAPMPCTCRQVTHPDNAIFSPSLASKVRDVWVYQEPLFDTHSPVIFEVKIEHEHQFQTKMDLPKSWIPLALDGDFWREAYKAACSQQGTPSDLQSWGDVVEQAADTVYRQTQIKHLGATWQQTKGLTADFRGRCKPRKIRKHLIHSIYRPGRPGDFQPLHEPHTFATMKMVTQLRRIRSLKGRVRKLDHQLMFAHKDLQKEWDAILSGHSFPGGFVHWCISWPELGPPPTQLPTIDYLNDLDQILTYSVNHRLALEASQWKDKQEFARQTDRRFHGSSKAFRIIKDTPTTYVDELVVPIDEVGVWASDPQDLQVEIFVDRSMEFSFEDPVVVNDISCRLIQKQTDSIIVRPPTAFDFDAIEVRVCQDQKVVDKSRIFRRLSDFWQPFWQKESVVLPSHRNSFETFLQYIPDNLPSFTVDTSDIRLWIDAIRRLKSSSARGVDAISAAELQELPQSAIRDLAKLVTTAYATGFPAWFMIARTFPLSKVTHTPQAGQIRPISVMAQIYRVWAAVCCKQLLAQLANIMPPEIQGLLRNRGPLDASYAQQFRQEVCRHKQIANGGFSIDLVKCFNTMCRRCGSLILRIMKLPESVVVQWENSIALLSRVWVISSECSQPLQSTNGYPEGDTWSVVIMVLLSFVWVMSLKAKASRCCITAYADNWGWSTSHPPSQQVLLDTTVIFVTSTNMQIDWDKSWIWSTSNEHANSLRRAIRRHIDPNRVVHVNSSMDLGCQLTYRGPPRLGKFRKRLHAAFRHPSKVAEPFG